MCRFNFQWDLLIPKGGIVNNNVQVVPLYLRGGLHFNQFYGFTWVSNQYIGPNEHSVRLEGSFKKSHWTGRGQQFLCFTNCLAKFLIVANKYSPREQ